MVAGLSTKTLKGVVFKDVMKYEALSESSVSDVAKWFKRMGIAAATTTSDRWPHFELIESLEKAESLWNAAPNQIAVVTDGNDGLLLSAGTETTALEDVVYAPAALWKLFDEIPGPLGSTAGLLKYDKPKATHPACIAATKGIASTEVEARDAQTPLVWAADSGHVDAVAGLLANGADVNAKGYLGATALSRAARNGDEAVLERLLESERVDLNEPNDKMQAPLHFAAFKKHRKCVNLLLDHGASTTVLDRKGRTPAEDTSDPDIRNDILQKRHAS